MRPGAPLEGASSVMMTHAPAREARLGPRRPGLAALFLERAATEERGAVDVLDGTREDDLDPLPLAPPRQRADRQAIDDTPI